MPRSWSCVMVLVAPLMVAAPAVAQPVADREPAPPARAAPAASAAAPASAPGGAPGRNGGTFEEQDVLAQAESVFGKGAQGLAEILRDAFRKNGEPNGYIAGSEGGGAFIVGLRYGSGILHHKTEGSQKVHWTGPSLGFDVGGDANKVFALVYNLHDTQAIFRRYPALEGKAYFVGGFTAHYLQRDRVIVVPIKLGAGLRLGVNAGYMKFTRKPRVVPF